jgi:hypothetical protein
MNRKGMDTGTANINKTMVGAEEALEDNPFLQ